jgi:hypothetical protein
MAGVQHLVIPMAKGRSQEAERIEFTKKLIAIFRVGIENYFL